MVVARSFPSYAPGFIMLHNFYFYVAIRSSDVISFHVVTYSCSSLPPMATTQPIPQPPSTMTSEETPPTTNQQTQEPVDPSEGTGTELRVVPTTSETATDLPAILRPNEPTDIGLIIGSATAGIVVMILAVTVVIVVVVLLKKHEKTKKEEYSVKNVAAVPTTTNQAYGLTHHSKSGVEEDIYNYPEVDVTNIEAKQNEAYVTHTDIFTEGNQAYATNIATEINSAYGPVETANEYDYDFV